MRATVQSPGPGASDGSTASFVIVRHAEKRADAGGDPGLTAAGEARANRLASLLDPATLTAVYATAFRRTRLTALPSAARAGLAITTYDAAVQAPVLAAQLRARHRVGTVVVVGHSNTVAEIASALCVCAVEPLDEATYDRLIRVHLQGQGRAILDVGHY